jgi:hypothetical protein
MSKKLKFRFGTLELFQNYVIAEMKEGITVIPEYNDELATIAETFYKNRPFAYITNRKNSYSVDPQTYLRTAKIENLVAFIVVSKEPVKHSNLALEKIFYNKPIELFEDLGQAIEWAEEILANTPHTSFKK